MKLLTNFKDYYDFLIQKYGIDENAFFERLKTENDDFRDGEIRLLAVCGTVYVVAKIGGKFQFGTDIETEKLNKCEDRWNAYAFGGHYEKVVIEHGSATELNEKTGKPVIVINIHESSRWGDVKEPSVTGDFYLYPKDGGGDIRLADYGIDKVLPAEEAFIRITNFLLRDKAVKSDMSDIEKVVSHGFDTKRSFRPKMK